MPRYVAMQRPPKAAQWDLWDKPATVDTTMTVYEADTGPEGTGLVDETGTPLYRVTDRQKMGFV